MEKTYRLGVIGVAHGHVNGLIDKFAELPNVEWVACADPVPDIASTKVPSPPHARLKRALERTGMTKIYDDYREMLDAEEMDIVIFCPANSRHDEVAEAIAAHKIHMLTEKPMAATLPQALRMARAAKANDVTLMVNWPTTWNTAIRKIKDLIEQDTIGRVLEVKWRNGPSMGPLSYGAPVPGPEKAKTWWHQTAAGGGALLDYCCYGACISRWFIGQPATAAYGLRANLDSQYGDAEDNAIISVRFPDSIALLEASWTTWNIGVPTGPIVYGERGTLVATHRRDGSGRGTPVVEVYTTRGYGGEPDQVVEGDPLPEGRETLAKEFIHHLETGEPLHPTLGIPLNLDAMAILDAGIRSADSGKLALVNNATWAIG